jgi:cytoskeletal protein RodZ
MAGNKTPYKFRQKIAAVVMLLALAWLTISLPFIYSFQQEQKELAQKQAVEAPSNNVDEDNPLSSTTEEKSETGVTQLSEFLHDTGFALHSFTVSPALYTAHQCRLHLDIHPEFFSPPPDPVTA